MLSFLLCFTFFLLCLTPTILDAEDVKPAGAVKGHWPQWRGPNRDAVSAETGLLQEWTEAGPPLLWRIKGLGKGYSTVTVVDGKIFTMGQRGKRSSLIALDAANGRELWATSVGTGVPNSTPTYDGGRVFALGYDGALLCAEADTGQEVWRKDLAKDFGGWVSTESGFSESLLVDGNRLICTPGAQDAMLVALHKRTGEVIWKAKLPDNVGQEGQDGAAYASIVVSQAGGIQQYIQLVGRGLISVSAKDGKTLWSYNRIANWGANVSTPVVRDDYVFSSTSYSTGSSLLKLAPDGSGGVKYEEVYFLPHKVMQNHHGGMVLVKNHIYCGHGHNSGFPLCIELKTGNVAWRPGRGPGTGSAAVLYADGHLYFRYENGLMALIEATPERYVLKGTFKIPSNQGKSWPLPVIAGGRLYLRDQDELLCYDVKKHRTRPQLEPR
jgi:outer membrane protein assembly factor BamB